MKRLPLALLIVGIPLTNAVANNALHIDQRTVTVGNATINEPTFRDDQGREVYLRGWNVSGSVKLASRGFKPFQSKEDAAAAFEQMKRHTGANLVRFTLSWEGTHTGPDQIDYAYVDALIEQMREAFRQHIYVFLDYHTDLYSRHVFQENSLHTGNGAPKWIIDGGDYPDSNCGPICFAWSQHNVTDPAVRLGYRNFFDNAALQTALGQRQVQDEFLWQLSQVLQYVKNQLTAEEFEWITGVQPINEPIYGLGHKNRAAEFDNDKLWPFYQRVRAQMNTLGWQDKWVYAEPMVFWDTNAGFFTPPTGGHYLKEKPGNGFVFAPHFYDAARMGVTNANKVYNGEYFSNLDTIREEARFLGLPTVLGEFGMWLKNQTGGARDYARIVKGTYQAMESSDKLHATKDRRPDFYTALVPGTQWHWDIYKDSHQEYQNGNLKKLRTQGDGWNGEDFSAIKGNELTVNPNVIQRAYPRFVDGNIVSFHYNDLATDGAYEALTWAEIRTDENSYFANNVFALLVWQGGNGKSTEIFLPATFDPLKTTLITESAVQSANLLPEFSEGTTGYRLLVNTTPDNQTDLHFALVVNDAQQTPETLTTLQQQLTAQLARQEHPVYFRGQMAGLNYPDENDQAEAIELTASESHFLFFRWVTLTWKAANKVSVWQKENVVMEGSATGSATLFSMIGFQDTFKVCEKANTTMCSRTLSFD